MTKLGLTILSLLLLATLAMGQGPKVILTNNSGDELPAPFAKQRRIYVPVDSIPGHWHCRIYSLENGAMIRDYLCRTIQPDTIDGFYRNYTDKVLTYEAVYVNGNQHGPETKYYVNQKTKYQGEYKNDQKQGEWKWYYPSGTLMADLNYVDDSIVSHQYYNENGTKLNKELNEEQPPEYPGGGRALMQRLATVEYPYAHRLQEIEGVVLVSFVIDTNGKIENPTVVFSADTLFSIAAMDVLNKMPVWSPGKQHQLKIRTQYLVPFKFKLAGVPNQDNVKGAKYYSQQGQIAYDEGDFAKAYDLFSQAVFLNSADHFALLNKAITGINIGKKGEACSCIKYLSTYVKLAEVKPYLKYCD